MRRVFAGIVVLCSILLISFYAEGRERKKKAEYTFTHQVPYLQPIRELSIQEPVWPEKFIPLYDTVSITFIGDVMQHGRQINDAYIPGEDPLDAQSYQYEYAFKYIEKQLSDADLAVANMEFPLGTPPYSGYPLFSAPESVLYQAQKSGIDLFLLANNHLMDRGKKGFMNTLNTYENAGARYTGAYRSREEEMQDNPILYNIKGIRIAFINFTYGTNGIPVPSPCTINLMDSTHVKECIKRAKEKRADIIICLPHWGEEYMLTPTKQQRKWAEMMFREGAHIIVGSHPHVPQGAEFSNKRAIFYSLGNYISNQTTPDYTQLEMMVTLRIQKNSHTGETTLLDPQIDFLWCFKKGEFAPHYTVVPVEDIVGKKYEVKNETQRRRMEETYRKFLEKGLINKNESLK